MSNEPTTTDSGNGVRISYTSETARLDKLAALCQRWGEICEQQASNDTPAMKAYFQGRADAHRHDAQRARDMAKGTAGKVDPLDRVTLRRIVEMMYQVLAGAE